MDQLCFHCHTPVTADDLPDTAPVCCELHEAAWWCIGCVDVNEVCRLECTDCRGPMYCETYTCLYDACGAAMCRECFEERDTCSSHHASTRSSNSPNMSDEEDGETGS